MTDEDHEYVPPRWERELTHPEKFTAIYLNETAMRNLKYTLSHVTQNADVTLSEAIQMICDGWIRLDNMRIIHEHQQEKSDPGVNPDAPQAGDWPNDIWCGDTESHGPHGDCQGYVSAYEERDDGLRPDDTGVAEPAPEPTPKSSVHLPMKDKQCDIPSPHSGHEWDEDDHPEQPYWCDGVSIKLDFPDNVSPPDNLSNPPAPGNEPPKMVLFDLNGAAILKGDKKIWDEEITEPLLNEKPPMGFQLPE